MKFKICTFCGTRFQSFIIYHGDDWIPEYFYVNQDAKFPYTKNKCPICKGTLVGYTPIGKFELVIR